MVVADIVQKYPETVEVLLGLGFHCVGCHVSNIESLEDGAKSHGFDDKEIDDIVIKLNEAITEQPAADGVTLTKEAIAKIASLLEKSQKKDHALRITVVPGGCAGFSYKFEFDNTADPKADAIYSFDNIKVAIDKESMQFMNGAMIDFVDTLQGSGFKITNPNAKRSCGCGNSFG